MTKIEDQNKLEKQNIIPLIRSPDPSKLIDFLKKIFDATESDDFVLQNNSFSRIKIGESIILISNATTELEPTTNAFCITVENVDKKYKKALECGAMAFKEPQTDKEHKIAIVKDNSGNQWWIIEKIDINTEVAVEDKADEMDESQTFSI